MCHSFPTVLRASSGGMGNFTGYYHSDQLLNWLEFQQHLPTAMPTMPAAAIEVSCWACIFAELMWMARCD